MKRDMDLVRAILLRCEQTDAQVHLRPNAIEDLGDAAVVSEHVAIMIEAGLVHGVPREMMLAGYRPFNISRITWYGHDFIDLARDDTLWNKLKAEAKTHAISLTVEVATAWLKAKASEVLGIPP